MCKQPILINVDHYPLFIPLSHGNSVFSHCCFTCWSVGGHQNRFISFEGFYRFRLKRVQLERVLLSCPVMTRLCWWNIIGRDELFMNTPALLLMMQNFELRGILGIFGFFLYLYQFGFFYVLLLDFDLLTELIISFRFRLLLLEEVEVHQLK